MQFVFQCSTVDHCVKRLHRLVVRTSRCGRDNPGSTPGEDIFAWCAHEHNVTKVVEDHRGTRTEIEGGALPPLRHHVRQVRHHRQGLLPYKRLNTMLRI